jgi:Lanthionine synthetase C-like protein
LANWRAWLVGPERGLLMQYCHGAPGFVINLAGMPGPGLDELLLAGGEATWAAGPLTKGSNLCHGTGGNGYAFLKLHRRTGDPRWLERARAFAMHGIAQTDAHERQYGRLRYSLWTGDPGFAIYLWDCLRGEADFPTLDVFFGSPAAA